MLRQSDGYLSGQQLCDHFQVSRTAVWKAINQLKEEGYEIEAVRNKGYRIVDIPDRITADAIKSCLETKWMAKNLEYYDEIDSTNNRAKALGEAGGADGTLFVAETQTAGKGRRGRCWQSPAGSSISMSILLRPVMNPSDAPMLTLVMAYAATKALREKTELDIGIKDERRDRLHQSCSDRNRNQCQYGVLSGRYRKDSDFTADRSGQRISQV